MDEIRTNPVTGNKFTDLPRRWTYSPETISAKFPVEGLQIFGIDQGLMRFEWSRAEAIDEADARDAQCRAGFSDLAYGFFGFKVDGGRATWVASRSAE